MKYTIYNSNTGQITSNYSFDSIDPNNDPNLIGKSYIEGAYNAKEYYIVNGIAVKLPANPSTGLIEYQFDWNTKTWNVDIAATQQLVRSRRKALLKLIDKVNPIWYATLTADEQTELSNYKASWMIQ